MHKPLPTFRERRYWVCGEVLQGPEEVPLMPGMATEVPGRAGMATEVPGTATELAQRCLMGCQRTSSSLHSPGWLNGSTSLYGLQL